MLLRGFSMRSNGGDVYKRQTLNETQAADQQEADDTKPPQDSDHMQSSGSLPKRDIPSKPAPVQQNPSRALTLADLICMQMCIRDSLGTGRTNRWFHAAWSS